MSLNDMFWNSPEFSNMSHKHLKPILKTSWLDCLVYFLCIYYTDRLYIIYIVVQGTGLLVRGMGVRGTQHGNILFHIDFGWLELFHLVKLRRCECLGATIELRCVTGHGGSKF